MSIQNITRKEIRTDRSYTKYLFILAINCFAIHLLTENELLLTIGYILSGLTILSFFITMIPKGVKVDKNGYNKPLIRDYPGLIMSHLKGNKRFILISMIGMTFVILILSQSMLMASTYRQEAISEIVNSNNNQVLQVYGTGFENQIEIEDFQTSMNAAISEILLNNELKDRNTSSSLFTDTQIKSGEIQSDDFGSYLPTMSYSMWSSSESLFDKLTELPTFNYSTYDETKHLLIVSPWDNVSTVVTSDDNIQIVVGQTWSENDTLNYGLYNISMDNFWQPTQSDMNYIEENQLWDLNTIIYGAFILPENVFWSSYQDIQDLISSYFDSEQFNSMFLTVQTSYFIEIPNLIEMPIEELQVNIEKSRNQANTWLMTRFSVDFVKFGYVESPLLNLIIQYLSENPNFDLSILMVSLPFYALAMYLLYFLINLMEGRRKTQIGILKSRGGTNTHLQSFLLAEIMLGFAFATIIGMITSINWTEFVFNASVFDSISFQDVELVIPSVWYWKVPVVGLILTLNIHVMSTHKLMNTRVEESEYQIETPSFISKYNIDLVLFGVAVVFWLVISFITFDDQETYLNLLTRMGPIMLFTFFLGFTLFVGKYISNLINFLSHLIWNSYKGILALGTINLRKNRYSSSKLTALLTMGIMLVFVSITVPSTYVQWGVEKASYDLGSDIYIDGLTARNQTIWNELKIDGIEAYTEIAKVSVFGGFETNYAMLDILGLNSSTFVSAAYWQDKYDHNSLQEIIKKITSNTTVGIQEEDLNSLGLAINDKLSIVYDYGEKGPKFTTLNIVEDFMYFPNLVIENTKQDFPIATDQGNEPIINDPSLNRIRMITNVSLVNQLKDVSFEYTEGTYVKIAEGANVTAITEQLQDKLVNQTGISITNFEEKVGKFLQDDDTRVLIISLQGMFILAIIINSIAVCYYAFISISERNKEIGAFRSIGMKNYQLFGIFFTEAVFLFSLGVISGAIGGMILSANYFKVISQSSQIGSIPPIEMLIPWNSLGLVASIMGAIIIVVSALPAALLSAKQTGNILREV